MANLEVKNGKVVRVTEQEVDVLELKGQVTLLRQRADDRRAEAAQFDAEADELEESLAKPGVATIVAEKEAEAAPAEEADKE